VGVSRGMLQSSISLGRRLIPVLDRIAVEKIVPEGKSKGGIIIPERKKARDGEMFQGTVFAVGPGAKNQVHNVQISN
jgi:chaperonin GroES